MTEKDLLEFAKVKAAKCSTMDELVELANSLSSARDQIVDEDTEDGRFLFFAQYADGYDVLPRKSMAFEYDTWEFQVGVEVPEDVESD